MLSSIRYQWQIWQLNRELNRIEKRYRPTREAEKGTVAFPHAMVLRLISCSPVIGLFCHRHLRIKVLADPGRADSTSANLTPASGRQDHTT